MASSASSQLGMRVQAGSSSRQAWARSRPEATPNRAAITLQHRRHQARQRHHPQQAVLELRAALQVGAPVAGVHVADADQQRRAAERPVLAQEAGLGSGRRHRPVQPVERQARHRRGRGGVAAFDPGSLRSSDQPRQRRPPRGEAPNGGRGGIRTHGALTRTAVFKTAALNRSATRPGSETRLLAGRPAEARALSRRDGCGRLGSCDPPQRLLERLGRVSAGDDVAEVDHEVGTAVTPSARQRRSSSRTSAA